MFKDFFFINCFTIFWNLKYQELIKKIPIKDLILPHEKIILMFQDLQVYCLFLWLIKPYKVYQMVDKHNEQYPFQQMYVVYQHQLILEMKQVNLQYVIDSFPQIVVRQVLFKIR